MINQRCRLKASDIDAETVEGAIEELNRFHKDFVYVTALGYGWAYKDMLELIAKTIICDKKDFIVEYEDI